MNNKAHLITRIVVAGVLLLHSLLLMWLPGKNVLSVLLSPGLHIPIGTLLIALFFIFIRIVSLVLLPGVILYELWHLLLQVSRQR